MQWELMQAQTAAVVRVWSNVPLLATAEDAMDLLATVRYESGCDRFVISRADIAPDFFRLSTGLAGEVLQKFINYQGRLAIVGDFSTEQSPALRDFIRESNRGRDIFFVSTEAEAVAKLTANQ